MPYFSEHTEQAIHTAIDLAKSKNHSLVTLEHLLLVLIDDPYVIRLLDTQNVDKDALRQEVSSFVNNDLSDLSDLQEGYDPTPTAAFQRVVQRAAIHVQSTELPTVTTMNILIATFAERESNAAYFLGKHSLTRYDMSKFISDCPDGQPQEGDIKASKNDNPFPKVETTKNLLQDVSFHVTGELLSLISDSLAEGQTLEGWFQEATAGKLESGSHSHKLQQVVKSGLRFTK